MIIREAASFADLAAVRALFEEYVAWLNIDLGYQGFAQELANLPGSYAPPQGRLLLALDAGTPAGCAAFRPLSNGVCEMKRLFVREAYHGRNIGRSLATRIVSEARAAGYTAMVLDTLPHMTAAIRLYESLGFVRRPAYYDTPLEQTVFFELRL
jgi:putative acetyltransferase